MNFALSKGFIVWDADTGEDVRAASRRGMDAYGVRLAEAEVPVTGREVSSLEVGGPNARGPR